MRDRIGMTLETLAAIGVLYAVVMLGGISCGGDAYSGGGEGGGTSQQVAQDSGQNQNGEGNQQSGTGDNSDCSQNCSCRDGGSDASCCEGC